MRRERRWVKWKRVCGIVRVVTVVAMTMSVYELLAAAMNRAAVVL